MATTTDQRRKPTPEEYAALRARLAGMSHEEKTQLAAKAKPLVARKPTAKGATKIPTTDDELHQSIIDRTGFDIPRVAVCEDHDAPFDFIADAYFERETALFLLGSRELGKTLGVSILHFINSEDKPRCESITFGAIEPQARRAYQHVTSFVYEEVPREDGGIERKLKPQMDGEPLRSETKWKNGSKVEIIVGTASGVNSPHGQKVHADEVDLMDRKVWDESRSISSSKKLPDGARIAAQDLATSTRKSMYGLVQEILVEVEEAVKQNLDPPWRVYISCIFEAAEEVPCCRRAVATERAKRLTELGRDPNEVCDCDRVAKGDWGVRVDAEGVERPIPRTLDSVCRGRFFRSRGWMPHVDVVRKFRQNTQAMWEAQLECRRPMADGLYLPGWTRERFTVRDWVPRPEYGQIWQGVDWGGSAESAILWIQGPLRVPVKAFGPSGAVTVPMNSLVVFDEYLEAEIGANKLAEKVVAREVGWRRRVPGWRVTGRFADMAGRQQRDDWREHDPPLRTVWYLQSRDFDPMVKDLQGLVEDSRYWVDSSRAARHCDDIESWRQKNGKEVHDDSSHSMAASRYCCSNVRALERRRQYRRGSDTVTPVVVQRTQPAGIGPVVAAGAGGDAFASERRWREGLGEHFDHRGPT